MKIAGVAGIASVVLGAGAAMSAESASWADKISLKGDLRLRHEIIDQDEKDTRHRWRLRARLSLKGTVNDQTDVHVRIASGNDDPVSTNQSLDGGFFSKDINLDRAYLEWRPAQVDGLTLWGGKTPLPFEAVKDLMWDGDLSPEGLSANYTLGGDGLDLFANAGALWAEERSSDADTLLLGGQLGAEIAASDTVNVMGGVGYFFWDNMQGFAPLVDEEDGFGNTTATIGEEDAESLVYANDYGVFEAFYKVGIKAAVPVSVYGDYIVNTEAETEGDTGYLVGVKLGKAKDVGSFELDYNYRDLEADATVGAFSDSDSFGGGTNGEGHKVTGKYQISKNLQAGVAVFLDSIDPDGADIDYTRAQFDLVAKF